MFYFFHHKRFEPGDTKALGAVGRYGNRLSTSMLSHANLLQRRWFIATALLFLVIAMLSACAGTQMATTGEPIVANTSSWPPANPPAGYFVPAGFFGKTTGDNKPTLAASGLSLPTALERSLVSPTPIVPEVLLYVSPTTQAFFTKGGLDPKLGIRVWEVFLSKYKIPFRQVNSIEQLEKLQPGVLLLPSTVALSDKEKKAVIDFRGKGGSVLASWLTGVRGEVGEWRGFDFMESALNVRVVGNTEADEDVTYLIPYGDSPVTHHLPAGLRVWLERASGWHPLRLEGRYPVAQVMDWARTFDSNRTSAAMVFDERVQASGRLSRSVVLAYPERLALSAEPKFLEAIAHNALMWLLRQPAAYVSAWPYPYSNAVMMVIDTTDVVADVDLNFAKMVEDAGGRATYFVLSDVAAKSADLLKKIQARGHELAFLGDRYEGFKDQPSDVQARRLDAARKVANDSGLRIAADSGFHAPLESYDKTTEMLLNERSFGYYLTSNGATDARLPFLAPPRWDRDSLAKAMVVLPRTQIGPEDAMEEGDPEVGLQTFLGELDLSERMGGVSLIRIPNQSLLTDLQLAEIFKHLKARREQMWLATGRQLAQWWRERERVSAQLVSSAVAPLLTVTIKGEGPLKQAAAVWVNLPESGSSLRLVPRSTYDKTVRLAKVDAWRAAVVLEGMVPGEYQWHVYFDRPATVGGK
ncbi:MAG: hypothetical protein ACOYNZ_13690 [Rhodoferax sp.]